MDEKTSRRTAEQNHANECVIEEQEQKLASKDDEIKTLEGVIRSVQEDVESARTYAAEVEEQLDEAKTCLKAVEDAINVVTFPW